MSASIYVASEGPISARPKIVETWRAGKWAIHAVFFTRNKVIYQLVLSLNLLLFRLVLTLTCPLNSREIFLLTDVCSIVHIILLKLAYG